MNFHPRLKHPTPSALEYTILSKAKRADWISQSARHILVSFIFTFSIYYVCDLMY